MTAHEVFQLPEQHLLLLFCFLFFVFLCIGSFLNVVIYRLPIMIEQGWQDEAMQVLGKEIDQNREVFNLAFPASTCPSCQAKIKPWQNIPVVSYMLLKGSCGYCGEKISVRYPFVELMTAVAALLVVLKFGLTAEAAGFLLLTFCLISLIGIDYDHQLLPDAITLPLLWLGLLFNVFGVFTALDFAVIGAIAGYLSLWSVYWLFKLATGKEGMGYGDFKLLAVFGAWFGWQGLPNIILLSSLVGATLGIFMMIIMKRDSQKPMAFGPFLAIAGWLTVMYPEHCVLTNYLS